MDVDVRLPTHATRAQQVQRFYAANRMNHAPNFIAIAGVEPGVDKLAQCLPPELCADLRDEHRHDARSDRIEIAITEQRAADTRVHDQGRYRVRSVVPRIRAQ